ncbi:MAG: methionine--tRNA ligase [Elusimicrobiota bacterium]
MKKYYISTPLYYVNSKPHIGHAYTTLAADVLKRHLKATGKEVYLQTGTDEHGINIERVARENLKSPKEWADIIVGEFKDMWHSLHIEYDYFIRTTDDNHVRQVQVIFEKMIANGDIYKGEYDGLYCSSCENFYDESELINGMCPIHKKPVEKVNEETYFFKLSKYQERLLEYYNKNPEFLSPSFRAPEILRFVESGLKDISVSRTRVKWGIPVLSDSRHTIYVWFDALLNYITGAGYRAEDENNEVFKSLWPCDVHLIGKEISRFHCVIWPAMLMSLGLPLPKKVYSHGWWTVEGEKMSKSRGNIINPIDIVQEYGVDVFRYFIFREVPFGQDGDFSTQMLKVRYNADLANGLGNLFSRVINMIKKYLDNVMPEKPEESELFSRLLDMQKDIYESIESLQFSVALDNIWKAIAIVNREIGDKKPWDMAKDNLEGLRKFLNETVWCLRLISRWIYPFMPDTSARMNMYLAIGDARGSEQKSEKIPPLFPKKS